MATSEPLVPTGLPYGERQQIEAAMDAADLPRSVPPAGPSPSSRTASGGGGLPPDTQQFDVFANREPSPDMAVADPVAGLSTVIATSQNPATRFYFSRFDDYKED